MMNRNRILFILITVVTLTIIALVGKGYNNSLKKKSVQGAQNELISVAKLKIDNIADWYVDELVDAEIIAQNRHLIEHLSYWQNTKTSSDSIQLSDHLHSIIKEHAYDEIILLSDKGELLISTNKNSSKSVAIPLIDSVKMVFKTGTATSTGLYFDEFKQAVSLDFIATVNHTSLSSSVVAVFRMNPNTFLFPLIQNWPLPSKTAETAIFKVKNDSIIYLNELRHAHNTALQLKIPVTNTNISVVKGILGGEGLYQGLDYRNIEVVSYVSKIEDTPWYMVAEIDKEELYESVQDKSRFFNLILTLLVLFVLALLAFLYSNTQKNSYKSLWLAQEEFKTTLYSIGDGVITTNQKGEINHMNPIAENLTGWKEEEAKGQAIEKVFHIINEINHEKVENPTKIVLEKGVIVGLANHTLLISRNGNKIPIADSGAPIFDELGNITGTVLVFRDQSDEHQKHQIIDEQRRRLFTLMSNLPGMAYRCKNDSRWTMEFVSKGCIDLLGYNDYEVENNKLVSYGDLINDKYKEYVWNEVEYALANKTSFELNYSLTDRYGIEKWVWEKGQGVYDGNGEIIAIEGFISDITKLKQIEYDLRQSENLFQTLALNLGVGIFKTNAKGQTVFVNPKYCEITGLENEEAMGLGWLKNVHPDDKQKLNDNWSKALIDKTEKIEEYRFINPKDASVLWVRGRVTPEIDSQGNLLGYIGYISDITDMVESEKVISEKNMLIDAVIQNIPDAVYMKDLEGRKMVANKADAENCGVDSIDELIGKNDFELFPENIAKKFWEDDQKVLKKGQPIIDRLEKLTNKQGETKWLYTSKIPMKNNKGKIVGMVGIGHDVTRIKKDEDEKIKLSTVVEQTPLSILITDPSGAIEYVNPTFTKITGYTQTEVLGKNPRILKSGKQSSIFYAEMWNTLTSGKVWSSEFQNRKKNGELYWEYVFITPIVNADGELINFAAVREDITEKKQLTEELIAAKIKAEESDRLKTSFLANMSHEIRTPLNSILGFTSILEESDDLTKGERSEYQSIIRKSSDSLLQIINDIIDISSLETGQLKIFLSQFDVNKMIKILYAEFTNRIGEVGKKHIELKSLKVDYELMMFADQNRLNQIFTNLLTNALKFTEKGFIEFGVIDVDEKYIYFKVEDSGVGIPEHLYEAVFERFRQGEVNNSRNYGGNGLGLSIVKNLISLMGGQIWVESEINKGSTFKFYIPINCEMPTNVLR